MNSTQLFEEIKTKNSYLCIGLDSDPEKIPKHLLKLEDPVFEFNKQIIDATLPYCIAYKPNVAFYEAQGARGWQTLQKTLDYIPQNIFKIADAKRGDIGNTAAMYARAFFQNMNVDALTMAPYMGEDSIRPFLNQKDKWVILLAHTSNPGSSDFQLITGKETGRKLYEEVIFKAIQWASPEQLMFVVGATHAEQILSIRNLAPDYFFLVPGVGSQGGDLGLVSKQGMNSKCGLLVNASRSIIYASGGEDFAEKAGKEAFKLQQEMSHFLDRYL